MRFKLLVVLFVASWGCAESRMDGKENPGLLKTRFVKLPLGAVKPEGWLKTQLVIQRNGLTGHLDEFVLTDAEWKGGKGFKIKGPPYRYISNYLEGLVPLAYLLEDPILKAKSKAYIEWILNSAGPDGWFTTSRKDGSEEGATTNTEYLCGALKLLIDYHEATGDSRVIPLMRNYFAYLDQHIDEWPQSSWWGIRAMEHAVAAYWLYDQTGDPAVLESIHKIHKNSFDWSGFFTNFPWDTEALNEHSIPRSWDAVGKTSHSVAVAWGVKFPGLWYRLSHNEKDRVASLKAIEVLDRHHGQAGGRFSGDEHLSGLSPTQGTELCAVVEYMYSLEKLLEVTGDVALADRLELLAFNSLPGTITPDCWAHQYDQQANQVLVSVAKRTWSTNGDASNVYGLMPNYPCCLGNMHHAWPRLVEHMWMATPDNGLAALVYGPCKVSTQAADGSRITIVEQTDYPFDGMIRFRFDLPKALSFPFYLRIPAWADNASIRGPEGTLHPDAGTIVKMAGQWKPGDVVELKLPMKIRAETRYNNAVSLLRGPVYFSLRIGKKYDALKSYDYKGAVDWAIRPTTPWNYALALDRESPERGVKVVRNPIGAFPFADKGEPVYDEKQNKYRTYDREPPVLLLVSGRRLPVWTIKNNSSGDPPLSPVQSKEPVEELTLVPYGCARLRITEFPRCPPLRR